MWLPAHGLRVDVLFFFTFLLVIILKGGGGGGEIPDLNQRKNEFQKKVSDFLNVVSDLGFIYLFYLYSLFIVKEGGERERDR